MQVEAPRAIGRWRPNGPWIGFLAGPDSYRLCVGADDRLLSEEADADVLLSLAIAYFEEALEAAPPDLEATHGDLSGLVRFVASHERESALRACLGEAIDAIDDGLAGDAVARRLAACRPMKNEQADPVDLLVARATRLLDG
ncbi:MAG TPA: hypothetical protein VGB34_04480 [Candidatus Limnocylindria bacterium]|jgi:hypothetical protein